MSGPAQPCVDCVHDEYSSVHVLCRPFLCSRHVTKPPASQQTTAAKMILLPVFWVPSVSVMAMLKKNRCGNLRALVQAGSNRMHVTSHSDPLCSRIRVPVEARTWCAAIDLDHFRWIPHFTSLPSISDTTLQSYPQQSIHYPKPPSQLNKIPTNCLTGTDPLVFMKYTKFIYPSFWNIVLQIEFENFPRTNTSQADTVRLISLRPKSFRYKSLVK